MRHRRSVSLSFVVAGVLFAGCSHAAVRPSGSAPAQIASGPLAAGLQTDLQSILDRARADSAFPGAFAVVGTHAGVLAEYGVGQLDWAPSPRPDEHTMWDLASLSKVIGLTTAMMQLVEQHRVDLDAPLQRYIPTWTGKNKEKVTVRHLLTHTAGLPAFKAYDQITHDPDSMAVLMFNTPLDTLPSVRMVYSDIGAYMLGRLVEQITGQSLDLYEHDYIFQPLQMRETMYRPPIALWNRIAPTEVDSVQRHRKVRGMVHDERAYYLGGVSAHAGLFSSGHDLARFAEMYLNGGILDGARIFSPDMIKLFTAHQVADRALGWQKPNGTNSAGHKMSAAAFGHTGFTGTSIWIDPERDFYVILLSNRVDPTRNNNKIGRVRVTLADSLVSTYDRLVHTTATK